MEVCERVESVLHNQLVIPEGRVHCPVVGCEVRGRKRGVRSSMVPVTSRLRRISC